MFIAFTEGKITNPQAFMEAVQQWDAKVRPIAKGWLGTTMGGTADGRFAVVNRFQDEASARATFEHPDRQAWMASLAPHMTDVNVVESAEVDTFGAGGSDDAGFVQIMVGEVSDKERMRELDREMDDSFREQRPEVIGGTTAWNGNRFVTTVYFTSEQAARAGEAQQLEGDAKAWMEEYQELTTDIRFIDLPEPKFSSP